MDVKKIIDHLSNSSIIIAGAQTMKYIDDAISALEELSTENKQLRAELSLQMALSQNGQSAIDTNRQLVQQVAALKAERDAAIEDIKKAVDNELICNFCKNDIPCPGEKCDKYTGGRGMMFEKTGQYIDEKWTCMDFNFGTCPKLEDTPCNGCFDDNMAGFEWRGCVDNE